MRRAKERGACRRQVLAGTIRQDRIEGIALLPIGKAKHQAKHDESGRDISKIMQQYVRTYDGMCE